MVKVAIFGVRRVFIVRCGMATFDNFAAIDIRVGRVVRAEEFPQARKPAYKLWIDFGNEVGIKQSSAQITERYSPATVVGMQVVAVVNLAPKIIAGFRSEVLVLGVPDQDGAVVLLRPDREVPLGGRVF